MKTNLPGRILVHICKYVSMPLCIAAVFFMCVASATAQTATFNYTGSIVNYTVPAGVTQVTAMAKGVQGGSGNAAGGLGAPIQENFSVIPMQPGGSFTDDGSAYFTGRGGNYSGGGSYNKVVNQVNTAGIQSGKGALDIAPFALSGAAINFDGYDDYLRTINPFYQYTNSITIEAWVNTTQSVWMGQSTANVDDWSRSNVWLWHIKAPGQGMDWLVNDAGTIRSISLTTLASGWHHIATVANSCGMFIYVDGVLTVSSSTGISSGINNVSNSIIDYGKDPRYSNVISSGTPRYTAFSVDEVRIWSRSLSVNEIQAHKNCELTAGQMNGLQEYYQFNQGVAGGDNASINTVTDASGNGRNASINNFAMTGSTSNFIAPGGVTTGSSCSPFSLAAITGNTPVCIGNTITLADATPGGTWSSSSPAVASVNASGLVTGLSSGTTIISYTIDCGTAATVTVTVNPIMTPAFTQVAAICIGGILSPLPTTSNDGISGTWSPALNNAATTTYTFTPATGQCANTTTMTIVVNTPPAISAVSGNVSVCAGSGAILTASSNNSSPVYNWYSAAIGGSSLFTGSVYTTPGLTGTTTYYVDVTDVTGCTSARTAAAVKVVTINDQGVSASPAVLCGPGTATITVASSQPDFHYTLRNNTNNAIVAGPVMGTGNAINFNTGVINATTTYNVLADNNHLGALGFSNAGSVTNNSFALNVASGFTVEGWLYMNSTSGLNGFVSQGMANIAGPFDIYVNNGILAFWIGNGTSSQEITTTLNTPATWYHIACVYDPVAARQYIYVNGALVNSALVTHPVANVAGAKLIVASRTDNGYFLNGKLDDIRIWNVARTAAQIANNRNTCLTLPQTGLSLYYPFDDVTGSTIATDASGNGYNGTLNITASSPAWSAGNLNCTANCSLQLSATPTITVNALPVITCPANITVNAAPNQCGANVSFAATATGTPIPVITYSIAPGSFFNVGTTTVTVTATNNCGTASCTFTVTVADTQLPNVVTKNVTVYLDNNGQANLTAAQVNNGSSDNCGIATMTVSPANFTCGDISSPVTVNTQTIISDNTWKESTISQPNPNFCTSGFWGGVSGSLPSLASYTITPTINAYSVTLIPGTQGIFGLNDVRFYRKTFNLTSLAGIKATLLAAMDNAAQIFINGVPVALESTLDAANFNGAIPERVILNSTGANVNGGVGYRSFDNITSANASSLFVVGTNEIVVALANCNNLDRGALSFKAIIENNVGGPGSVVLTVTDINGNSASATAQVTVVDTTKPVIICQPDININATSAAGAIVNYTTPVGTDNCSATTARTAGLASGSTFPIGATTVTHTATDAAGNTANCSFTVTVAGLAPVINCPASITVNAIAGQCGANVAFAATETTAIPASVITYTENNSPVTPGSFFSVGTHTILATAVNAVGSAKCSFIISVVDDQFPVLTGVPSNITVECNAVPLPATVTATDNCITSVAVFTETRTDGNCPSRYTLTRKWSTTDASGNTTVATQVITVQDTQAPVLSAAPADVTVDCNAVPGAAVLTATDNCDTAPLVTYMQTSTQDANVNNAGHYNYTLTRTWTATDACMNFSTKTQVITVHDVTAPVITVPANVTLNCQDDNSTSATGVATGTDNCGPVTITYSEASTQVASVTDAGHYNYTITRTWTATDVTGNYTSATQTITVRDSKAPEVTVPANISVNNDKGVCGAVVNFAATAMDNCSPVTITYSSNPGTLFNVGVTTVTVTAKDVSGNTTINSFTVSVSDTEKPTITSAPNQTQTNDAGDCGAKVTVAGPTTGDNCAVQSITNSYTGTENASGHYPFGTTTITWTVTDTHGNTNTATQQVTVTDDEKPNVITKPVTVTLVNGVASITAAMVDNGSTDNCRIQSIEVAPSVFHCVNIGSNTVTLTVTDIHGNVAAKTAIVTVVGEIPGCTITSVPTVNTFTGGNPNNLYLGYGAQSTTLQVTPTGVSGNGGPNYTYTYSWSGASVSMLSSTTSGAPVFTPTKSGYYTFTVVTTNNYGCSTTCTISICVTDIRVPGTNGAKVYVCHLPPGNTGNPQTLSISVNAVPAHLGNHAGDRLGSCSQAPCSNVALASAGVTSTAVSKEGKEEATTSTENDLKVTVMPNPSATIFTLKLESRYATPVNMRVMDANGRVIDTRSGIGSNSTIQVGHSYSSGTYYAELIQDNRRKVVQLIKGKY